MEPNEIAKEQDTKAHECKMQQELDGLAESEDAPLNLDKLNAVAGGTAGTDTVEIDGQVVEVLPNFMFQVRLDNGNNVRCHLSGRLQLNYIRILPGDRVRVQSRSGNPSKARIVWRYN